MGMKQVHSIKTMRLHFKIIITPSFIMYYWIYSPVYPHSKFYPLITEFILQVYLIRVLRARGDKKQISALRTCTFGFALLPPLITI